MNYAGFDDNKLPNNNYVFTKEPIDYVTIDYNKDNGSSTGSLKVVVVDEPINRTDPRKAIFPDNAGVYEYGMTIDMLDKSNSKIYSAMTRTDTSEYPLVWRNALHKFAAYKDASNSTLYSAVWGCET